MRKPEPAGPYTSEREPEAAESLKCYVRMICGAYYLSRRRAENVLDVVVIIYIFIYVLWKSCSVISALNWLSGC